MRKKFKKIIFHYKKLILPYSTITPIFQTPYNHDSKFKEINSTYNKKNKKFKKIQLTNKINTKILKENSNTLVIQCDNFDKKPKSQQLEQI